MDARSPNPWPWVALTVAIVAVAVVALALILEDDESGNRAEAGDGAAEIARVAEPVGAANDALSKELRALVPGGDTGSVRAAIRTDLGDVRAAEAGLAGLDLEGDDVVLGGQAQAALAANRRWLGAVRRAIAVPNASLAAVANRAGKRARTAWTDVARTIPGAGGTVGGFGPLNAWAVAAKIPDGDAGPETPVPQPVPETAPGFATCEGFENVFEVVVEGVTCAEGIQIAQGALSSKSAAGAQGYTCSTLPHESSEGTLRYECDGPDGGHVGFTTAR